MDFGDIGDVLSSATDLLDEAGDFLGCVRQMKSQWQALRLDAAHPPASAGWVTGQQARPSVATEIIQVAAANGDSWVPETTAGFGGIDLTGVWCPPMNFYDRCTIRQSGAYLNVAAMIGGMMTFAGEGLFDPRTRAIGFAGRYANGAPAAVRAQLLPNGMITGTLSVQNPWGVPMANPLFLQRAQ